jgi:hypothetical protein
MSSDPKVTIDQWGFALDHHDDAEVERLVSQSRADRADEAASGRLGTMLGGVVPPVPEGLIG